MACGVPPCRTWRVLPTYSRHRPSREPRVTLGRPRSSTAARSRADCVQHRKRRLWEAFHRARNERLLDLLERFGGLDLGGLRRTVTTWPSVLPSDTDAAVRNAVALVGSGIQSRRTAYAALGGLDPDQELAAIVAEAALLGAGDGGYGHDGGNGH